MDFSAFSDPNFDVKNWVNDVFATGSEAIVNKENHTSQLVMKLQLFIQEVNNSLEETSQQVLQNLPRVVRDAESIRQEVELLQSQMKSVKGDVEKVERNTAQSMQMLLTIDGLKSRMQIASKALQEADNWTTLSVDVDDVFQSGDFDAIASKLQGMQQSLKILVDIPDYKERCQHLESLKNRLETLLSPHLIAAINNNVVDSAQIYVRIFKDIERLDEVRKYYHKCHKVFLSQKWKESVDADTDYTLVNRLSLYYDMLLSHWHTQMKWCSQVFPDLSAFEILCSLLTDTLQSIDPSISSCIGKALKQQDNRLDFLIEIKQVIERFSRSLSSAIKMHNPNHQQAELIKLLALAIRMPLITYVRKYATYEEKRLVLLLDSVPLQSEDQSETIRLLSDSVVKIFIFLEEANNNCLQFTNGCGYQGLSKALTIFFGKYVDKVKSSVILWKENLKFADSSVNMANDWTFLQQALQAIQISGEIVLKTEALDQTLVTCFVDSLNRLGRTTKGDETIDSVILSLENVCCDQNDQITLKNLSDQISDDQTGTFLKDVQQLETKLCETVGKIAFDVFFAEIQRQLNNLPNMKTWNLENPSGVFTADLPTFGLVPQEYITQIGQYLMTVPQHIEPFILQDNPAVHKALKLGKLPHSKQNDWIKDDHIADYFLGCVATATCETYVDVIFKISQVTQYAARQLAADIDYLCNVLDDLGLQPLDNLVSVSSLLKASSEDYSRVAEGKPASLVSAIRGLRNLVLVEN